MNTIRHIGQGSAILAVGAAGAAGALVFAQLAARGVIALGQLLIG